MMPYFLASSQWGQRAVAQVGHLAARLHHHVVGGSQPLKHVGARKVGDGEQEFPVIILSHSSSRSCTPLASP